MPAPHHVHEASVSHHDQGSQQQVSSCATARNTQPAVGASMVPEGQGRAAIQLKGSLRRHDFARQVQMLAPEKSISARDASIHAAAARGIGGSGGKLPYGDRIQRSFGAYDISNVQAHADANATDATAAMGADAYASGHHVVLGAGGKDLHTVAHEAAHVVQQRSGVSLAGGVGQAGDPYERHADAVADLVVQGKSAEGLLGEMAGGGGARAAVQRQESKGSKANDVPGNNAEPGFFELFAAGYQLPASEREWLERETGDRMGIAFTKYVDACNAHISSLRSAATVNRDIFLVIADVALALLAPGGGKALAGLVNSLPVASPGMLYAAALPLLDNANVIVSAAFTGGKRALGMAFERAMQQPEDEAFVESLKEGTSVAMQDARAGFRGRSDAQMAVLCSAFDARIATKSAYGARIGALLQAFKRDVEPIGRTEREGVSFPLKTTESTYTHGLVAVEMDRDTPVLVHVGQRIHANERRGSRPSELHFVGFVDPAMARLAVDRANASQPAGIQTVPRAVVKGLPALPIQPVARL